MLRGQVIPYERRTLASQRTWLKLNENSFWSGWNILLGSSFGIKGVKHRKISLKCQVFPTSKQWRRKWSLVNAGVIHLHLKGQWMVPPQAVSLQWSQRNNFLQLFILNIMCVNQLKKKKKTHQSFNILQ